MQKRHALYRRVTMTTSRGGKKFVAGASLEIVPLRKYVITIPARFAAAAIKTALSIVLPPVVRTAEAVYARKYSLYISLFMMYL